MKSSLLPSGFNCGLTTRSNYLGEQRNVQNISAVRRTSFVCTPKEQGIVSVMRGLTVFSMVQSEGSLRDTNFFASELEWQGFV